jgi:hypothetical protein
MVGYKQTSFMESYTQVRDFEEGLNFGTMVCAHGICRIRTIELVAWEQDTINRVAWRGKIRNGIGVKVTKFVNRSQRFDKGSFCLDSH